MRSVVRIAVILVSVAARPPVAGADTPDPQAVLEKASAALSEIKTIRYEAEARVERTGRWGRPEQINVSGTLILAPDDGALMPKVSADCTISVERAPRPMKFSVIMDGDRIIAIDRGQRTYQLADWPAGQQLAGNMLPLLVREFVISDPLAPERAAAHVEHAGIESVGQVECDVIRVSDESGPGSTSWYIGRTDHLPRRIIREMGSQPKLTFTTTITNLAKDPEIDAETFAIDAPKGFTRVTGSGQLAAGQPAPTWTLKDADGHEVALKKLRGNLVVLDFWATWCGPCKRMMPAMQKMHEKYEGKPVKIFGVNCMERGDPVAFMKRNKYTYPTLLNGDAVKQQYRVRGIPTFYLIGPEGEILMAFSGASPDKKAEMERLIDQKLAEMSQAEEGEAS